MFCNLLIFFFLFFFLAIFLTLKQLTLLFYLVIFFTDRLILVGEVGSPERFAADVALHAVRVVELLVRLDRVALDRLLADHALLNDFLKS